MTPGCVVPCALVGVRSQTDVIGSRSSTDQKVSAANFGRQLQHSRDTGGLRENEWEMEDVMVPFIIRWNNQLWSTSSSRRHGDNWHCGFTPTCTYLMKAQPRKGRVQGVFLGFFSSVRLQNSLNLMRSHQCRCEILTLEK